MKKYLLIIIAILFLACNSRETIKLTLVFDKPLSEGKYPAYFKDLVMPFEGKDCNTDFLLKPINTVRLDVSKAETETNAWYFENTGDNTVEFSKAWLEFYFTDSLVPKQLTTPSIREAFSIDPYLEREDILIFLYSQNAIAEEYKGFKVFASTKDINDEIQSAACKKLPKEVIVILNPSTLGVEEPIAYPIKEDDPEKGGDPLNNNPCDQPTVAEALDLRQDILEILDVHKSDSERVELANEIWEKYFTEKAFVASYRSVNDENPDVWNPGEGRAYFTNRLAALESVVGVSIFRIETSQKDGKISGLHLIECHNAIELQ